MRLAICGVGRNGRLHARNARRLGVDVLLLMDLDPTRADAVAVETGACALGSLVELVAARPDAAVVSTPTTTHPEIVTALLESGIPTLCEKPLALDLATTEAIGEVASRTGTLLQVGFQRRYDPGFAAARRSILEGAVGRVYLLRLCSHDSRPLPVSRLAASGSIFRDLLIHDFDAVRWLTRSEVTSVGSHGSVLAIPELVALADYDVAAAALTLESGALAVVTGGRHNPAGHDVRLEVFGSITSLAVGLDDRTPLERVGDGPPRLPGDVYRDYRDRFEHGFRLELDDFLRSAAATGDGGARTAPGWRDSYAALRIALAAERSARTGERVAVAAVH